MHPVVPSAAEMVGTSNQEIHGFVQLILHYFQPMFMILIKISTLPTTYLIYGRSTPVGEVYVQ
jgi:hypothetical protein